MLQRSCSGHLYDVLELPHSCTTDDVKHQYRRLALRYHPDRNNGNTTVQFQEVEEAHRVLGDPEQRTLYDAVGREGMKTLGDYGLPEFLLSVRVIQPVIALLLFFVAMLLLALVLIAAKVDGKHPSWPWQAVLTPVWVVCPIFLLTGCACLATGVRQCALPPLLVGTEMLLLVVIPAVACAALQGRLSSASPAFVPVVLYYASCTVRALYNLLPSVYARTRREEEELYAEATGTTREDSADALDETGAPRSPWRSRAYLWAIIVEVFEVLCVTAFFCTCFARAAQGPVQSSSASAEHAKAPLSFWVVFAPLILYFGTLVVVDFAWALCCAGSRFHHSDSVVIDASEPDGGAAPTTSYATHRGATADEPYGATNGATPYTSYDDHAAAQRAHRQAPSPERARHAGDESGASSWCARLAGALVAPFAHACVLYMVCMWAAKEEVEYNHRPPAGGADPSVYAATFPLFVLLVVALLVLCCLSCAVRAVLAQVVAQPSGEGERADSHRTPSSCTPPQRQTPPPPPPLFGSRPPSAAAEGSVDATKKRQSPQPHMYNSTGVRSRDTARAAASASAAAAPAAVTAVRENAQDID